MSDESKPIGEVPGPVAVSSDLITHHSSLITVKLFAKLRDLAGADAVTLALPDGATVADVRRALADRHPELAGLLARSAVAVDQDIAADETRVTPGAEVAVLPPVSGG